jgi:pilus assembly protein Flp/PilA
VSIPALLKSLISEESGQDLIEYALVAAIVALSVVGAMRGMKNNIGNAFNTVGNQLANAVA